MSPWERSSTARVTPPSQPRKLAKVPFVELADGRLQGIVSSGSDLKRVYVSSIAAKDLAFTCRTNNNRPCGGAHGSPCKHIDALIAEAALQYGADRVTRYLRVEGSTGSPEFATVLRSATPADSPESVTASVFARFLHDLALLEIEPTTAPLPEMQWFAPLRTEA